MHPAGVGSGEATLLVTSHTAGGTSQSTLRKIPVASAVASSAFCFSRPMSPYAKRRQTHLRRALVNAGAPRAGFFSGAVSFVIGLSCVLRCAPTHSCVSNRVWRLWSLHAQVSSNVSGPCLRQRGHALELTIWGQNDMWIESGAERWRRKNQVMTVDRVTSRCMVVVHFSFDVDHACESSTSCARLTK